METEEQVYEELRRAGEALKAGLWRPEDLETLKAIAHDVVQLDAKADLAAKGKPARQIPIDPPVTPQPPITPKPPVTPHPPITPHFPFKPEMPMKPAAERPIAEKPIIDPVTRKPFIARPVMELDKDRLDAIRKVRPDLDLTHGFILEPAVPPDADRAAMYRAAANRALDSAANLAIIRAEATAPQVDPMKQSFLGRLWQSIGGLLPGLSK